MPLAPGAEGCVTGVTPRVLSLPASGSERSRGQVLSTSGPRFPLTVMKAGTGSPAPEGHAPGAGTGRATSGGGVTTSHRPTPGRREGPLENGQNVLSLAPAAAWKLPEGAGPRHGQRLSPLPALCASREPCQRLAQDPPLDHGSRLPARRTEYYLPCDRGQRAEDGAGGNRLPHLGSLGPRREASQGGPLAISRPQGRRQIA